MLCKGKRDQIFLISIILWAREIKKFFNDNLDYDGEIPESVGILEK